MNVKKSAQASGSTFGSTEQQGQPDSSYGEHMHGSRAPPWQNSAGQYGKMFRVPTPLKPFDEITIKGVMVDRMLNIELKTEYQNNVVCQLNVVCPDGNIQSHNQLEIRTNLNGDIQDFGEDQQANDYFDGVTFDVNFKLKPEAITLMAGNSYLQSVPLRHNYGDISFISVRGQVEQLNFTFATNSY